MDGSDTIAPTGTGDPRRDEMIVRRGFWRKLRRNLHRLPFLRHVLAAWYCAVDPATPATAKAVLMGALAYFVIPADLIPDWLAGFGFVDDAAAVMAALRILDAHVRPGHYEKADATLVAEVGVAGHRAAG